MYYVKGAGAGGICCSLTHGALTPVDVVKTRVQLDPVKVRSREKGSSLNVPALTHVLICSQLYISTTVVWWEVSTRSLRKKVPWH